MRVAIASCKRLPEPDPDEHLLLAALARDGVEARVLAWDDPAAPFAEHDLVVLRSTWNYFHDVGAFVAWAERTAAATRLLNPAHIVRANVVKTYLRDLAARGVDVVPTEFVEEGRRCSLRGVMSDRGWRDVVIKPAVSAASFRTQRFGEATVEEGQRFLDSLISDRDAMVQPWIASVDTTGERSLVWIDGEVTHAIRKSPRFAGGTERVSDEVAIAEDERAFAERAVAPCAAELLYARVDVVRDVDGALRLMELELVEPSLFLQQCPRALDRLVAAIRRRCG